MSELKWLVPLRQFGANKRLATMRWYPHFIRVLAEYAKQEKARLGNKQLSQPLILATALLRFDPKFRRLYLRHLEAHRTSEPLADLLVEELMAKRVARARQRIRSGQ